VHKTIPTVIATTVDGNIRIGLRCTVTQRRVVENVTRMGVVRYAYVEVGKQVRDGKRGYQNDIQSDLRKTVCLCKTSTAIKRFVTTYNDAPVYQTF
jgi:hypothetical protein